MRKKFNKATASAEELLAHGNGRIKKGLRRIVVGTSLITVGAVGGLLVNAARGRSESNR